MHCIDTVKTLLFSSQKGISFVCLLGKQTNKQNQPQNTDKRIQFHILKIFRILQKIAFLFGFCSQSEIKLMTFPGKLKIWGLS